MKELIISADVADIARVADDVDAFCEENGLPPRIAFDLNLAIDELATNTISYGFAADCPEKSIVLRLSPPQDGWVEAQLADNGRPYDPFSEAPPPVLEGEAEDRPIGGLGVHFVRKLMDEVAYQRDGGWNRITLRRRIQRDQTPDA